MRTHTSMFKTLAYKTPNTYSWSLKRRHLFVSKIEGSPMYILASQKELIAGEAVKLSNDWVVSTPQKWLAANPTRFREIDPITSAYTHEFISYYRLSLYMLVRRCPTAILCMYVCMYVHVEKWTLGKKKVSQIFFLLCTGGITVLHLSTVRIYVG